MKIISRILLIACLFMLPVYMHPQDDGSSAVPTATTMTNRATFSRTPATTARRASTRASASAVKTCSARAILQREPRSPRVAC